MILNIKATLSAPGDMLYIGGRNFPVFSKEVRVEITPDQLQHVLKGYALTTNNIFLELKTKSYKPTAATILGEGMMRSGSAKHIEELIADGWVVDEKALEHYNLPRNKPPKTIAP